MQLEREKFGQEMAVRLFRLWSMAREDDEFSLVRIYEDASRFGYPDETAISCVSLFELIENHLGRKLERECCCSRRFSSDEQALLGVIRSAPRLGSHWGSVAIPHGLPGAICWAATSVRRALGISGVGKGQPSAETRSSGSKCPFNVT